MKIVVAPDSFKGSLSAVQVADCIEKGIKLADPQCEVIKIPIADGGEGTVEALVNATGGEIIHKKVYGPLMKKIDSYFGVLGDKKTAVIEMAAAAGLRLVEENSRNPMNTTTYGVGELIKSVLDLGYKNIIIGIGGSSTNDGGMGMAQALGVKFYDKESRLLGNAGRYMGEIATIDTTDIDPRIFKTNIIVACDVKNPLFGMYGAAYVYGPQKGATPQIVEILDNGLRNLSNKMKQYLDIDISEIQGSGAAGGLGGGLIAFCKAQLAPGIEIIMKYCNFEEQVMNADLLITGEGRTDMQTCYGKVPVGIAKAAEKYNVPVVCLSGGLGEGYEETYKHGIDFALSHVRGPMTLEEAILDTEAMLIERAYGIVRLVKKLITR